MSEPESAFLKLEIDRHSLVRWMRARPSPATRWTDWRAMGGEWYLGSGVTELAKASDAQLATTLREVDAVLASEATNHALLTALLSGGEAPESWIAAFDKVERTFVAGSIAYSENLNDFMVFLSVARSMADHLAPSGHGLALIQNFIWGDTDTPPTAAIRMMPSGESRFLDEKERGSVVPAFQPIADAMLEGELPPGFAMRDQLRLLK